MNKPGKEVDSVIVSSSCTTHQKTEVIVIGLVKY